MHAIELAAPGLDQLRRIDAAEPLSPTTGRILVRMKAASMNYLDLAVAHGQYPAAAYPVIPVMDGAGEVIATGPQVWQVAVGDRVIINCKPRWTAGSGSAALVAQGRGVNVPGSLIEIAELSAASVVKVPDFLSWEAAACLPTAAMTAWKGLEAAAIGPGSSVLLLGTGGVSIFALQFAAARGAEIIITSSSDAKLERARKLGAHHVINYRSRPDWETVVRDITGGRGIDLVMEGAGGPGFSRSIASVRYGGLVFAVGFVGGTSSELDLFSIIGNGVRIEGTNGGSVADLAAMVAAITAHRIEPVIDRTFSLSGIADAYALMAQGAHFGKIGIGLDW